MFDYLIKVKKDKNSSQISDETSTELDSNGKTEIQVTLSLLILHPFIPL